MGSGIGFSGGNYKNEVPSLAAKKAAKALFKKLTLPKFRKYKNKTSIKFVLRMRDRHGPGKTFSYVATCKKLKNPVVVKRGDAEYTIKYQYFAEPCKLNSTEVKTMTGGELALVGGKLTFTGKNFYVVVMMMNIKKKKNLKLMVVMKMKNFKKKLKKLKKMKKLKKLEKLEKKVLILIPPKVVVVKRNLKLKKHQLKKHQLKKDQKAKLRNKLFI